MEKDVGVTKGVRNLWRDDLLIDYTIEVGNEKFKVHKVIIASVSDYFKVMLTGSMAESQTDRVRLEGLDALAVSNIIEYIYTGAFGDNEASTEELLACAVYLQIPSAIELCTGILQDKIDESNCFDILTVFKTFCLTSSIEDTIEFIKSNIEAVLDACNLTELSHDNILNLMQMWAKSEWDSFVCIKEWVNTDPAERKIHLNDLMCKIRFGLMTPAEITAVRATDIYLTLGGSWHELVDKATHYHKFPTHLKVLETSEQNMVREEASVLCFPSGDRRADSCYCLQEDHTWEEYEASDAPEFTRSPAAVVNVNNFLIVCSDSQEDQKWFIFDPRTMMWSSMAGLNTPRRFFALAHHQDSLYAFGGRIAAGNGTEDFLTSIEKYNFTSNSWHVSRSELLSPLWYPSACTVDDLIYVCGRSDKSLATFDPTTGTLLEKPSMLEESIFHKIQPMEIGTHRAIGTFTDCFAFQYYIPTRSQWTLFKLNYSPFYKFNLCENLHWYPGCTVINNGPYVFLLNYGKYGESRFGKCVKWTIEDEDNISEVDLEDLPICPIEDDERLYFGASMSVPPKSGQPV